MPFSSHRAALTIAASSVLVGMARSAVASIIRSAEPFVGVTQYQFIQSKTDTTSPVFAREVVVNVLKIDTQADGIHFQMQGGNGSDPGEITRTTTRSFVNGIGAQMGINAGFYDTTSTYGGLYTDLNYIAASNGDTYSTAAGGEAMFNITADNKVKIGSAGSAGSTTFANGSPAKLYNASGGNQRILNGGNISAPNNSYTNTLNPHTAFGASQDGRYVFLATVDGRQTDYSEGMYTTEFAQVLKDFGAWNAINLDGGGSTTMVMDDAADGLRNARVINSPSDNSSSAAAGTERVVANSLAVFANPNLSYTPLPDVARPALVGQKSIIAATTTFDGFEGGVKGHFTSTPNASGSSRNVDSSSSTTLDTKYQVTGRYSLRLDLNTAAGASGMQCRFLSGGGTPANNVTPDDHAMGNTGFVGVYLRVDPGSDPLYVSMLIDDGTTQSNGLELGSFSQLIADGAWHLYQWDLSEDGRWTNFTGGNGVIDGPNAFIDSLYFSTAPGTSGGTSFNGSIWMDMVEYNPDGRLVSIVPEPAIALLACALPLLRRRRG